MLLLMMLLMLSVIDSTGSGRCRLCGNVARQIPAIPIPAIALLCLRLTRWSSIELGRYLGFRSSNGGGFGGLEGKAKFGRGGGLRAGRRRSVWRGHLFVGGRLEVVGILDLKVFRGTEGVIGVGNLGIFAWVRVIDLVRGRL